MGKKPAPGRGCVCASTRIPHKRAHSASTLPRATIPTTSCFPWLCILPPRRRDDDARSTQKTSCPIMFGTCVVQSCNALPSRMRRCVVTAHHCALTCELILRTHTHAHAHTALALMTWSNANNGVPACVQCGNSHTTTIVWRRNTAFTSSSIGRMARKIVRSYGKIVVSEGVSGSAHTSAPAALADSAPCRASCS